MYKPSSSHQRGFTLIEVMIALVILAVGLLGMASLMARSQKSNESAYSRSQATLLAYDIVERMRTNLIAPADANKKYKVLFVTESSGNASSYTLASLPNCTSPTGTIPTGGASRASYDIATWCSTLRSSLPSVDTTSTKISFDTTKLNSLGVATVTVKIQWQDNSTDGTAPKQYVEVVTTL
ncbi:type IV pilus modification protein PilV [Aquipseudomonas campi]